MKSNDFELGLLIGGHINQFANAAGQIYYYDATTGTSSFGIPSGFEDQPGDTWSLDPTKPWPLWHNNRTLRADFIGPNTTPPPQTYLDLPGVKAFLNVLRKAPESPDRIYRRPMFVILQFLFPKREGYEVTCDNLGDVVMQTIPRPNVAERAGVSYHMFKFLLGECKGKDQTWSDTEGVLLHRCSRIDNDSKMVYGMVQIGWHIQFFRYQSQNGLVAISGKMHIVDNVADITNKAQWMRHNPLPFV